MLRFTFALALISAPMFLSAVETRTALPSGISLPSEVQTKGSNLPLLRRLVEENNWSELRHQVKKGAENHSLSLRDLQMLALSFPSTPFFNAVFATKNILSIPEKTGLSLSIVFPIALFAETSLKDEIADGKHFWGSNHFGRELQYDKENSHLFIHLGTHGVKPVGVGRMKVVTKTILYDREHPEMMARGVSEAGCKREMYAMSRLGGLPNVLEAQALMRHKDPKTGKKLATIVTKIIRPGCLQSILDNKSWNLTMKERVKIACDIMRGIAGMQKKKFVHCDLGARNYFVSIKKTKHGHRKITAYVADFGRTIPIKHAKDSPVQGNSRYTPPEAIFREKMHGKQYFNSDLFAVGCVFWQLYFGDLPPWSYSERFKDESIPKNERYRTKTYYIDAIRARYLKRFDPATAKKRIPSLREGFLKVILQMTDSSPAKRGKANEIYISLYTLLTGKLPPEAEDKTNSQDGKGNKKPNHKNEKGLSTTVKQ